MALKHFTDEERFFQFIEIDNKTGCWNWKGFLTKSGYGMFSIGSRTNKSKKTYRTHRWAYRNFKGKLDPDLVIDHRCKNRACSNPDHLDQVTTQENSFRSRKSHCVRGHEMSGLNIYIHKKRNIRQCRSCKNEDQRKSIFNRKEFVNLTTEQKRSFGLVKG